MHSNVSPGYSNIVLCCWDSWLAVSDVTGDYKLTVHGSLEAYLQSALQLLALTTSLSCPPTQSQCVMSCAAEDVFQSIGHKYVAACSASLQQRTAMRCKGGLWTKLAPSKGTRPAVQE